MAKQVYVSCCCVCKCLAQFYDITAYTRINFMPVRGKKKTPRDLHGKARVIQRRFYTFWILYFGWTNPDEPSSGKMMKSETSIRTFVIVFAQL